MGQCGGFCSVFSSSVRLNIFSYLRVICTSSSSSVNFVCSNPLPSFFQTELFLFMEALYMSRQVVFCDITIIFPS